jgi:hypothetical protein
MAVGAAKGHAQTALLEALGHGLGVLDGLLLEFFELLGLGQLEGQRQGCEDVDMRSALFTGEDGLVELFGQAGSVVRMTAPRGPSRVLWVVEVMTWA